MTNQTVLNALLRQDLVSFVEKSFHHVSPKQEFTMNWHIRALAHHLEQCRRGNIRRLIITLPPRHLKSIAVSVAFPAFVLGHDPTKRIVNVSYSAELAGKLARDCRLVMMAPWFKNAFPDTRLNREKNAELDFTTTKRGYRLSTSVGGTLTGRGGNMIIVDDPLKPDEAMSEARRRSVTEWFDNTLYSRLDDKRNDVIILVMQRLHPEDLVGHILAKDESWAHLNLPAIAEVYESIPISDEEYHLRRCGDLLQPVREPRAVLDELRRALGSFNFAAQYQQAPIPPEGEILKWGWFRTYAGAQASGGRHGCGIVEALGPRWLRAFGSSAAGWSGGRAEGEPSWHRPILPAPPTLQVTRSCRRRDRQAQSTSRRQREPNPKPGPMYQLQQRQRSSTPRPSSPAAGVSSIAGHIAA